MTTPHERLMAGVELPADMAHLAEARAEGLDDLRRLREAYRKHLRERSEAYAVSGLVQGLLDAPSWTRLELTTALVEAIAILEGS